MRIPSKDSCLFPRYFWKPFFRFKRPLLRHAIAIFVSIGAKYNRYLRNKNGDFPAVSLSSLAHAHSSAGSLQSRTHAIPGRRSYTTNYTQALLCTKWLSHFSQTSHKAAFQIPRSVNSEGRISRVERFRKLLERAGLLPPGRLPVFAGTAKSKCLISR